MPSGRESSVKQCGSASELKRGNIDLFFAGTVIPLNLSIGLPMVGRSQDVPDSFDFQVISKAA
jgi:hypothetical protein